MALPQSGLLWSTNEQLPSPRAGLQFSSAQTMRALHYGFAAVELGAEVAKEIAQRLEGAPRHTEGILELPELPIIEMRPPEAADHSPSLILLNEPQLEENLRAQLERASESDEEFEVRQKRMEAQYNSFTQPLYNSGASFLLANLTLQGIFAIFSSAPGAGAQQVAQLLAASESHLRILHHTAIQVGIWGAVHGLPEGEKLLRKTLKLEPVITYTEGMAKLPAEASSLWCYANNATCKKICHERLLTANNDKDISLEVLAAYKNNQEEIVTQIVEEHWASDEPAKMYRALTIAGFCDASPRFNELLNSAAKANGYMGIAAKAAKGAYDRNCWARHWYTEMRSATGPVDFWRASVLFTKIVDARFELWSKSNSSTKIFDTFWHSVSAAVKRRIAKWHDKRKDKLFGHTRPDDIFLSGLF